MQDFSKIRGGLSGAGGAVKFPVPWCPISSSTTRGEKLKIISQCPYGSGRSQHQGQGNDIPYDSGRRRGEWQRLFGLRLSDSRTDWQKSRQGKKYKLWNNRNISTANGKYTAESSLEYVTWQFRIDLGPQKGAKKYAGHDTPQLWVRQEWFAS